MDCDRENPSPFSMCPMVTHMAIASTMRTHRGLDGVSHSHVILEPIEWAGRIYHSPCSVYFKISLHVFWMNVNIYLYIHISIYIYLYTFIYIYIFASIYFDYQYISWSMSFSLYFYIFACVWSSFYRSSGYDAFPKTPKKHGMHHHNDQTKLEDLTLTENMLFLCWMNICVCLIYFKR